MSCDRERNSLDELLEEFVRAHLAGEVPDPVAFASRAGPEAPRLREAIALYLVESEPVEPSPEAATRLAARFGRVAERLDELLEEFVRAHLAGEVPDPVAFASRAGPEAPRLREAIALYLVESEPVEPSPEAATRLAARYAGKRSLQRDAAAAADSPASTLALLLANWRASTVEWRTELLDWMGSSTFGLTLAPETMRGTEPAAGCTRIPLRHPSGASVEIDEDDQLRLTIFGMPSELVGSCPLVAFPWAPADSPDLTWAGHDLPDGLVEAEAIGENRVLHAQVGRLVDRENLERLLREIRVVGVPAGRAQG